MGLQDVPIGERMPEEVNVAVEMPRGSSNKYEYDAGLDVMVLNRALFSPLYSPTDYGWVAQTLAEDGDPLDIMVVTTFATFPGCVMATRPLGVLRMSDDKGKDEKILAVSARDPRFAQMRRLDDLPEHLLRETTFYFQTYKELEEKVTEVLDWAGQDDAYCFIRECHDRWREAEKL